MSPFVFMASEIVSGNQSDSATSSARSIASAASSRCPAKNWIRPSCAASIARSASGSSSFRISNAGCIRASASSSIDAIPHRVADPRRHARGGVRVALRSEQIGGLLELGDASSTSPLMSAMKPACSFSAARSQVRTRSSSAARWK